MILAFLMLSFKPPFALSFFTRTERLFSPSPLPALPFFVRAKKAANPLGGEAGAQASTPVSRVHLPGQGLLPKGGACGRPAQVWARRPRGVPGWDGGGKRRRRVMESGGGAYGAAKAGGTFDLWPFLQQPQVVARLLSAVFALIVFSCIIGEGYTSNSKSPELYCIFNHSEDTCRYGIGIGVIAFLACIFFFMVDVYFPQISSATDRKYLVMADLAFSAVWSFLWFIGFCVMANQWSSTKADDITVGIDSARASIAFSFFSIFSWGLLVAFALQRYRMGVQDFDQSYIDPAPGPTPPYSSYPNVSQESYQQPPFTRTVENSEGYQPPPVY